MTDLITVEGGPERFFRLGRRPGRWSVSAEITLDLMRPLPSDGSILTAHNDGGKPFAIATVTMSP